MNRDRIEALQRFRLTSGVIGLLVLLGWEAASRTAMIPPLFFPPPSEIFATIAHLLASGELTTNIAATLVRLFAGFLLGASAGLSLGILLGLSPSFRRIVDPMIASLHPVPKISLFPLIMIIFGIGALSKSLVVAIAAFFPIVINTMTGVREISPIHFEVASNYGASRWHVFRHVILPGSSPMILAGVRLALNISLSITTSVELIIGQNGLGAMIWLSWQTMKTEKLFAAIFCLALIGIGFRVAVNHLERKLVPWQYAEKKI